MLFADKPKYDSMGQPDLDHEARDQKAAYKEKNKLDLIHIDQVLRGLLPRFTKASNQAPFSTEILLLLILPEK